jgi:hypothetical protein
VLKNKILFDFFNAFIRCKFRPRLILAAIFSYRSMRQFPVDYSFTLEEWHSVLKLASLYQMNEVTTLAVGKMEPLLITRPSLQVHIAKAYHIRKWLAPGFFRLAQRTRPLDEWDVKLVGLQDSLKICALREKIRRCETCAGIHSGGFQVGLGEIGHAFHITGSDLPGSVAGCEQNCTCHRTRRPSQYGRYGSPSHSDHSAARHWH